MSKSEARAAQLKGQADEALEEYLEAVERIGANDAHKRHLEHLRSHYLRLQEAATWAAKRER